MGADSAAMHSVETPSSPTARCGLRKADNLRGGSRKGIPNKITTTIKTEVLASLEMVGGRHYLAKQAIENPPAYMSLLGKVIPQQVGAELGGLTINVVSLVSPTTATAGVMTSRFPEHVASRPALALVQE
jgi:hypothetical protein